MPRTRNGKRPRSIQRGLFATSITEEQDTEAPVIELREEDIVDEPSPAGASAFRSLFETGNPRSLTESMLHERLRELEEARKFMRPRPVGLLRRLKDYLFGPSPSSYVEVPLTAMERAETALREATRLTLHATSHVEANNSLNRRRMILANSRATFKLEKEKIETEVLSYRVKQAAYEAQIRDLELQSSVKKAADVEIAAVKQGAAEAIRLVQDEAASEQQRIEEMGRQLLLRVQAADSAREHALGRVAELERRVHAATLQAEKAQQAARDHARRAEALAAEVRRLEDDLQRLRLRDPARAREEQRAHAEFQTDLARLKAEAAGHRAKAKQSNERTLTPAEQLARRARERMRDAKNRKRVMERLRREANEILAQTAARHGEGSDEYLGEQAMFDELQQEFEEDNET